MQHAKPGNPGNTETNKKSSNFDKIDFHFHNRRFY